MNDILRLEGISKKFGERTLYKNFSFSFPKTGLFALVGQSGSGKSTLLEMISGLDASYDGAIYVLGKRLQKRDEKSRSYTRLTKIGFVRQGYDLLELETALENVTLPLHAVSYEKKNLIEKRALDLLSFFDMKRFHKSRVFELSGGEKQRVALSRSLSIENRILLADEPTGALDSKNAAKVYRYLKEISFSHLVIFVTHDEESAQKYADGIFRIEHETIIFAPNANNETGTKEFLSLNIKKRKTVPTVPFSFWLKHAFHLFLARKRRASISVLILSISLFSLGAAVYLSYDANQEIDAAFSSLIGSDCIVMKKEGDGSAISSAYAATMDDIEAILSFSPSLAIGYGVKYSLDWNEFFPDFDSVYVISDTIKAELSGFAASVANDYVYLGNSSGFFAYPDTPLLMEDDQIILGLPYSNMVQLCLEFQIVRDYKKLGMYLSENEVNILFDVANSSWNYEDSEVYSLIGVVPSDKPTIYHTNPLWNVYFFETRMRFPVTDGAEHLYPWTMQKLYYLRSNLLTGDFFEVIRHDSFFSHYLFDPRTVQTDEFLIKEKRYFVYFVKRNSLSFSEIATISKKYGFSHYSVYGEQSYVSFPEAMMSGFYRPFYMSKTKEELVSLNETLSVLPIEQKDLSPSLSPSIKEGSYRYPFSSSVTISSRIDSLLEGRAPKKANEVVLSRKLYEAWERPKTIYVSGAIEEKISNDYVERDYRVGSLDVVGVAQNSHDILFVTNTWSIDFFRDELGMSPFYLEPMQVSFEFNGDFNESLVDELKAEYPLYSFENPFSSISQSTESVIKFTRIALLFASFSSLIISFLLLLTVSVLSLRENHHEGRMLFTLGISLEDIHTYYAVSVLLPLIVSALLSLVSVSFAEYFIHYQIASSFSNIDFPFHFSFLPLAFVLGACVFAGIVLCTWLKLRISSYDFRKNHKDD